MRYCVTRSTNLASAAVTVSLIAGLCATPPLRAAATPAVVTDAVANSTARAGATPTGSAPTASAALAGTAPATAAGATQISSAPTITPPGSTPATTASADDIRDIRGPKGIFPLWIAIALAAALGLLAAAGYGAWRWRHRKRKVRPLRPFEIALQRLEEVRPLMRPSSVREFSIAISDIVRRYIEDEFNITATHRTTEEFLHDLLKETNASLTSHRNLLAHFLNQCDVAKFAAASLSARIMESLYESARSFVIETSKPTAAQTPEGPAPLLQPADA